MPYQRASIVIAGLCISWAGLSARAADLIISEFMASNGETIADADGDYPDWIEIFNSGTEPVDLAGWSLTDDAEDLGLWKFPRFTMAPGEFRLVFASGKHRTDPAGELHTSFRLGSGGEYLALVAPGRRVATAFAPSYPPQLTDASYGFEMTVDDSIQLIAPDAPVRWTVPTDASLGETWIAPDFDDTAWSPGRSGLGYDTKDVPTWSDWIATDVAAAMRGVRTSIYARWSFEVADPAGLGTLRLRALYADGYVAWINGVEVALVNAPTRLRYTSRALRDRAAADATTFEDVTFQVQPGLLHSGANVLAIQGLNRTRSSEDFLLLPVLQAVSVTGVLTARARFFSQPTPGLPNARGSAGIARAPAFSSPGGAFTSPISVEITTAQEGGVIRYTLDGKQPTEESPLYEAPIPVDHNTTINARAFGPGLVPSKTVRETYFFVSASAASFSTNLPILLVETPGLPDQNSYRSVFWALIDGEGERNRITDPFTLSGPGGLKRRGSSSGGWPKNNFGLETRDATGDDFSVPLLGLPTESDWVLHGPYSDKSLMRNELSMRWSNDIGQYAPRTRFVEMFLKTAGTTFSSASYWGVYLVMEKIKRDPERVAIEELLPSQESEPEVSGGWILKKDRADPGEENIFVRTPRGQVLRYVEPKYVDTTPAQRTWVARWLAEFENALYSPSFADPAEGYEKYIDVESFIDHHILTELCKNIDGYRLSTFCYKDRGKKLHMGPLWDFNLSLGNANYLEGWLSAGWYYTLTSAADYGPWYPQLFRDPGFVRRYAARWTELRAGLFATSRLLSTIDEDAALLAEAAPRNFAKWRVLGRYDWPNWHVPPTWESEVDWMKGWLVARLDWIDAQYVLPPEFVTPSGPVERGFEAAIDAPDGEVWITLNGPDPRAESGEPAPEATVYAAPIPITENTRIRARLRVGGGVWSGLVEATYVTDVVPVVITELMYNPPPPPEESEFNTSEFEFLEVQNIADRPADLAGVILTGRLKFDFTGSPLATLGAGEYAVVVKSAAAFAERYPDRVDRIAGEYQGILSNRGQNIDLIGPLDEPLIHFSYRDAWYPETDGEGYSLVIRDPRADRSTWGAAESWRASLAVGGSPGAADEPPSGGLRLQGDLSQDGRLNVSDAVAILGHLFRATPATLPCGDGTLGSASNRLLLDINGDGGVNLSDPVYLLRYLFLGGGPPSLGVGCVEIEGCEAACTASP